MERLDLDCELLEPLKSSLELALNKMILLAYTTDKEAEINLKINIGTQSFSFTENGKTSKWAEPRINYQINKKLKEYKDTKKGLVGFNFQLELDKDNNLSITRINEQETLFEKEEK